MVKLLLVEDNVMSLQYLHRQIPWETHGIRIVGAVTNGKKALPVIEQHTPDIVLTDIRMPQMDGLQLTEWIRQRGEQIQIVILTAYDQFEYSQKALKAGAADYILKPIDDAELLQTIGKVRDKIMAGKRELQQQRQLLKQLEQSYPLLRQHMFTRLISGSISEEADVVEALQSLNISASPRRYCMAAFAVDNFPFIDKADRGRMMSDLKACAIAELPAEMEPYLFFFSDQLIALAYFDSGDVHTGEALSELRSFMLRCSNITYRFQHTANETLSVGISYIHHSLATARKAYEEAMLSLEYRFFNGRGSVIYRGDLPDCPELPAPPVSPDKKMIVFAASGNMQELSRQLERFRSSFHELKISNIKIIKTLMLGILLQTLNQLQEHGFDDIVENASLALEGNTSLHLLQCETFESAFELFKDSLMHMCKSVMESGPARFDNTIHQAVGYIQTNYDKNLTVKQVADYVGLNTSYFSHRFKKVMGVSFTSFLTKTRMDKAKSLLENRNLKTSHIAELVGIQDPRYFSKLFKSYIGSTPSEFKGNVSRRLP